MAFYEHGNLMAEDPTCFFEPEDESTVSPHEEETNRMFKRYAFMVRHAHSQRSLFGGGGIDEGADDDGEGSDPFKHRGRA
jgi:hypothetical protein